MTTLTMAVQDSTTMLGRELKHTIRFPLLLVGSSRKTTGRWTTRQAARSSRRRMPPE